jgi:iron complex outermembrane receptor protein
VVRGPELEAAGQSSADVLARVPGVVVQRTGAKSDLATASIRGSDSTQVPVYVAGIRVNDDVSGTADLSTIPLWMMDRVEVFRGNAPANGDQLGIGGAVFFWPRLPKTTRVGAGASVGSFGSLGGFVSGEVGSDKASALIAVRRDQSDNDYEYLNDGGTVADKTDDRVVKRKNGDFVAHDAWAIGRYKLSRTDTVSTVMNAYDREQGVTGIAREPATYARGTVRRLLTGVSGRFGCPGARDTCKVDVQGSLLSAQLTFTDPRLEVPALRSELLANGGERAVVRAFVTADVGTAFTLGGGVTQSVESIRIEKPGSLTRQGHRESTHLVATATLNPAPPFRIFGLGALDCHTTSGVDERFGRPLPLNSGTCGTLEPALRLGTTYGVSRHVELVANAGRYVRMPSLSELYGTSPLVQGNPALLPETGRTVDAGVRVALDSTAGRYALDAFAFARWGDDMIRYRTTSFGVAGPYNVGRARILGVETALSAEWLRALRAQISATVMDPRDTTEGTVNSDTQDILPLTPRLALSARLEAFAARGLEALRQDRVALALAYLHRASRYADQSGQTVLPVQNVVDIEATTAHLGGAIIGRAAVRNVFDAPQADVLGMPLPGRSFHAEIEAWW